MQATPVGRLNDLGTPSAPPILDIGADEENSEQESGSGLSTSGGFSGTEHNNKKHIQETPEEAWYTTQDSNKKNIPEEACHRSEQILSETESRGYEKVK